METPERTRIEHPDEGMFYEKVFGPQTVRIEADEKNPKRKTIVLTDENGEQITLIDRHAVRRFFEYFYRKIGIKYKELTAMEAAESQGLIQEIVNLRESDGKPIKLKFHFEEGECKGVSSMLHQQISWAEIKGAVQDAVDMTFGKDTELVEFTPNTATYKMPTENKNISLWAHVDAGNNLAKGRSAVRISTRVRTDKPGTDLRYRDGGGNKVPACMNWANVWIVPLQMFGIKAVRINEWAAKELEIIVPGVNIRGVDQGFGTHEIHMTGNRIPDINELIAKLKKVLEDLVDYSPVIEALVEKSLKTSLSRQEMEDILVAYAVKKQIPKYMVDNIMASVAEETVWGFSQAVSWVRTHGEIKSRSKSREEQNMTRILESIAGEVYCLAPTIAKFHNEQGAITYEKLTGEKDYPERYQDKEAELVIVQ